MSKLWYKRCANNWNEALPLGNGRIGTMSYSNPVNDVIYLNEETLWSGNDDCQELVYDMKTLREIREHIRNNEFDISDKKISDMMCGKITQLYLTLGQLRILNNALEGFSDIIKYKRTLNIDNAMLGFDVSYKYSSNHEIEMCRTYEQFVSMADDVMIINVSANKKQIKESIILDIWLEHENVIYSGDMIYVNGKCPVDYDIWSGTNRFVYSDEKESIPFCVSIKVLTDGNVYGAGNSLSIENASYYTLIYSIETGFNGYNKKPISEGKPYKEICAKKLENALKFTYDELKQRHIVAYKKQYDRVELCLDGDDFEDIPTDERIKNAADGIVDNKLTELLFDYARYLTISSSQPGGQPSTLQGIWTKDIVSPWNSNYTININTEMNYWAVEQVDLPECHIPLINMVKELSQKGNHYGLKGWCCSHNTDLWRFNLEATKGVCWGYWHMGGIWLARHIYEHYLFTRDDEFLKEYFPVLEGIYDFLSDWMIEDENGCLTTSPSTSPENSFKYNSIVASAAEGSAMDLSIIADYLTYMCELCPIVKKDKDRYEKMYSRLKKLQIGSNGRILEYSQEFEEVEKGHRHISHLYGVYPANTIKQGTQLFEAAKKTLEYRLKNGGGHTGWSNAWIANVYARFKDGEKAYSHIINMFKKSIYPNMLDAHPPFQIDGNFGICAAICEMLVQSHNGRTELIPAIPSVWRSGYIKGIKTREGKKISFSWKDNEIIDFKETVL